MTIATRSTAIAAFASRANAERAICSLLAAGFVPDQLGLVLSDADASPKGSGDAGAIVVCVGRMFRSVIGEEIPDAEIRYYEEEVEEGRPLVMVRAGDRYQEAVDILDRNGGEYMPPF